MDRIVVDPEVSMGKPCIRGTRISVESVLELLAAGWYYPDIEQEFKITREDILAVLSYATKIIQEERVYKVPA